MLPPRDRLGQLDRYFFLTAVSSYLRHILYFYSFLLQQKRQIMPKEGTLLSKITVSIFKHYFSNTVCYLVSSIGAQKILQLKSCVLSTHYNTPLVLFTPHSSFELKKYVNENLLGLKWCFIIYILLIQTDYT